LKPANGFTRDTVVSRDANADRFHAGRPRSGLVLVQGAMGTARNYDQLAGAPESDFTILLPDRRGRDMSPKSYAGDEHQIARDLDACSPQPGHAGSSVSARGAMIVLDATRTLRAARNPI
jgi:hypothetical protein